MKRPDEPLTEEEFFAAMSAMRARIVELTGNSSSCEPQYRIAMQGMIDLIAELEAMMKSRGIVIKKPSDIII